MDDLDRVLQTAAADAHRRAAAACVDIDGDLAATLERAGKVATRRAVGTTQTPAPPRRVALLAAAGFVLVVGAGLIVLAQGDDSRVLTPSESTPDASVSPTTLPPETSLVSTPGSSEAVATTMPIDPATQSTPAAPAVTPPATDAVPDSTVPINPASCDRGLDPTAVAASFSQAMVLARLTDDFSLVADCLTAIPDVFTGEPPACWTSCPGTLLYFEGEVSTGESTSPDATVSWYSSLPVTYQTDTGFLDVWESWQLRRTPYGYEITDYTIQEPPFDRATSFATIVKYFGHIDRGEWTDAAAMLDDGALELSERPDLQELAPASYTLADIAAALEDWCRDGCDTEAPTAAELKFTGAFHLERYGRDIAVRWYEGHYSIAGLPFSAADRAS